MQKRVETVELLKQNRWCCDDENYEDIHGLWKTKVLW